MNKIKKIIKLLTIALLLEPILAPSSLSFAMNASNQFSVGPMNQEIILTPGETFYGTISVTNPATATAPFYYFAQPAPFSVVDEDYNADFITESDYTQMSNWMTIENPEGSIEPNNTTEIIFSIDVPSDAPAGGQYAAIKVANNKNKYANDKTDSSITVNERFEIVSVIYASVAGNTRETGNILENNIAPFIFTAPLSASSLVEDTGNVHGDAEYTLQVYPLFSDEEVYTNEENPLTKTIMPGTKRTVVQTWDETPAVGIFKVKQTIKLFDKTSVTEKIVMICPVWLLVIITFVIFLIIFWLMAKSKSRKKSKR